MQLLNVLAGGSLVQHLPDVVGHDGHQPDVGLLRSDRGTHRAGVAPLEDPGRRPSTVQCSHHQAVDRLGRGLVVTASAPDGVVEAVESPSAPFVVGVEWHPEQDGDLRLFEALVRRRPVTDLDPDACLTAVHGRRPIRP